MMTERFEVEWNTGCGWQSSAAHRFWSETSARACAAGRLAQEKLAKWPMRLRRTDLASGVSSVVAIGAETGGFGA